MTRYRANFYDKNSDETRTLTVEAPNEDKAEDAACTEADKRGWSNSFRLGDVEEVD